MSRNDRKKWIACLAGGSHTLLSPPVPLAHRPFERLRDAQALRDYLSEQAPWSHLIFFGLQLCSVIIAPIPAIWLPPPAARSSASGMAFS